MRWWTIILVGLLVFIISALLVWGFADCTQKDPQVILPGWRDARLEFDYHHLFIVFLDERGEYHWFINTAPGWYEIDGYIENVWWCDL